MGTLRVKLLCTERQNTLRERKPTYFSLKMEELDLDLDVEIDNFEEELEDGSK